MSPPPFADAVDRSLRDAYASGEADAGVRCELARRIARLLPGLDRAEAAALREDALAILERLAADVLPQVRAVVAEELCASAAAPKPVVLRLARDVEDMVACPVLQFSPLLGDDDLREILAAGLSERALCAVARRQDLSADRSDDVAATLDIPAIAALLANESARIREDTLERIVTQAETVEALHAPLAMRAGLSIRTMKRIAGFVAAGLIEAMAARNRVARPLAVELFANVRQRIEDERFEAGLAAEISARAQELDRRGMLDEAFMSDLIEQRRRDLAVACLARMAGVGEGVAHAIMASRSGRAVTALAWAAGLSMRTAYALQIHLACVPPDRQIAAKDGTDYPVSADELRWHLAYFADPPPHSVGRKPSVER